MKLKPVYLETEQEAQHRMIDGGWFKFNNLNIYYSSDLNRFVATDEVTSCAMPIPWKHVTEWQVEVPRTWEDDVREGKPILCDVTRRNIGTYTRKITQIDKDGFYIDDDGVWWESATPVTPDDPAIYKGDK